MPARLRLGGFLVYAHDSAVCPGSWPGCAASRAAHQVPRHDVFNDASITRSAPFTLRVDEAEAAKRRSYNHNPLTGTRQPLLHRDYHGFRAHQGELSRIGKEAANTSLLEFQ